MENILHLRKQGNFYCAYEDDAYVLSSVMGYKVSNGKAGFPLNSLGKVENKLEEYKISYVVLNRNNEETKKVFKNNKYNEHIDVGKYNNNIRYKEEELIKEIDKLGEEDIQKIMDFINKIVDEKRKLSSNK